MYHMILIPIVAAIVAQIIKLGIDAYQHQFSWRDLDSYGGMPSSHSAMVTALCASIGYFAGWDSAAFAISLAFAIITMRDAVGFRREIGLHAHEINKNLERVQPELNADLPHLAERIGHSGWQVLAGIVCGLGVTVLYILIFI